MYRLADSLSHWFPALTVVSLASALHWGPPEWTALLSYDRARILSGEYWRIASGHFTHTNLNHLLLNLASLCLYWGLFAQRQPLRQSLLELAALAGLCGLALLVLEPQVGWYRGLSGLLHGLLAMTAAREMFERGSRWRGGVLLVLVTAKVFSESTSAGDSLTARWIDAPVVHEAHLWGLCSGVLLALTVQCGLLIGRLALRSQPGTSH